MSQGSAQHDQVGPYIRGYELVEQIGEGAFAVVWRARQASVDRDVAVKQIHEELATQPEFIRRFEAEAHLVARLQHPNIVPLVDFWREPNSALLVMQYLRGGTLERRLDDGPLAVDDVAAMLSQVGAALGAAHERGIVHRDVKSANVLFDEHGNAYLSDFGIALDPADADSSAAALSPGTPLYAAPEQLRRERVGPPADVFGLGIVAYECLTGSLPFADTESGPELFHRQMHEPLPDLHDLHGIDRRLSDAVARATAKDPAERFPTAEAFVDALVGTTGLAAPLDVPNPYRGLHAFEEADARAFFGRDRLRRELIASFAEHGLRSRCGILVGASGSGKSSVVRAGLVPSLRRGEVPGSEDWFITTMTPGSDPFASLGEALSRVAQREVDGLDEVLRSGPRGLLRAVRLAAGDGQVIALFVDQFEELFVHGRAADAFLSALAVAVKDSQGPLRVIATLRADFYDRPLAHRDFAAVLKQTAIDVTPLAADELEDAILGPAHAVGLDLDPGLLARIVADTGGETAPLPLLQFALTELFERRAGGLLTNEAYQEIGGLAGALAARAEQLHDEATEDERQAIRRLFGRLTASDRVGDLRRRARVADVDTDGPTHAVLERFAAARLLTFDRDPETRTPTVEVAHEALLAAWPRLNRWLSEDRDTLRRVGEVAAAADRWNAGGRYDADTLRGARLASAESLADSDPDRLRPVDVEFVQASVDRAEHDRRTDAKRVRRLRALVGATAVALVVALVAAAVAWGLRDRAEQAADEAREQRDAAVAAEETADLQTLISRSGAVAAEDPTLSVLLALEAHQRAPGPETERVVLDALTRLGPIVATHDPVPLGDGECDRVGGLSQDGLLQYASVEGRMIEHDIDTETSRDVGALADPCAVWFTTHFGERIVEYRPADGTVWASPSNDPSSRVQLPTPDSYWSFFATETGLGRIAFATSETSRSEATVQIYDVTTGTPVGPPIGGLVLPFTNATPDGETLVISASTRAAPDGGGPLVFVDGETGEERFRTTLPARAQSYAFDPARNQMIFGTSAGLLTVDANTGEIVSQVDLGSLVDIRAVLLRDDDTVAIVTNGRLELVDRDLGLLAGAGVELRNAARAVLRPDGRVLIQTEDDRNLVLDLDGGALVDRAIPTGRTNVWVEYSTGVVAATQTSSGEVDVIDVETGERVRRTLELPDGTTFGAIAASATADGDLVTFDTQGRVALWRDGAFRSMVSAPSGPDGFLSGGAGGNGVTALGVAYPDGSREAVLVRTRGEAEVLVRAEGFDDVSTAVPSAEGGLHVATGDRLLSFDRTGQMTSDIEVDVCCARFGRLDPVSGRIALGGDRGFYVHDPATGETTVLDTTSSVSNAALVRGGTQMVVGQRDGTFQLWDVETGELAGVLHDGDANTLGTPTYDPDTDSVWISVPGRAIRVPLDPAVWVERACDVAGRELTAEEWAEFVPGDRPQSPVCA